MDITVPQRVIPGDRGPDMEVYIRAAEIVKPALEHIPPKGSKNLLVEHVDGFDYEGHHFVLVIDLVKEGLEDLWIYDHKTTRDFKWALSAEELRTNTQALIYSFWGLQRRPDLQSVNLQWTYMRTQGKAKVIPVRSLLKRRAVEASMPLIAETCTKMDEVRELKQEEVIKNPSACGAYGGCPYLDICSLSKGQRFSAALKRETKMGLKDKVNKAQITTLEDDDTPPPINRPPDEIPTEEPEEEAAKTKPDMRLPPKKKNPKPKAEVVSGEFEVVAEDSEPIPLHRKGEPGAPQLVPRRQAVFLYLVCSALKGKGLEEALKAMRAYDDKFGDDGVA